MTLTSFLRGVFSFADYERAVLTKKVIDSDQWCINNVVWELRSLCGSRSIRIWRFFGLRYGEVTTQPVIRFDCEMVLKDACGLAGEFCV